MNDQSNGMDELSEAVAAALREPLGELRQRIAALEAAVVASLGAPEPPVLAAGGTGTPVDPLRHVWDGAPLAQRIQFVRSLMPEDHPQKQVLGEVSGLVELCGSPAELQSWLARYPTLFAEAAAGAVLPSPPVNAGDEVGGIATELLAEVRTQVGTVLGELGVTWTIPAAGEVPASECEVVGEEPASDLLAGRVKRVRRPGFRRLGRLELPAQVILVGEAVGQPGETLPPPEPRQRVAPSHGTAAGTLTGPATGMAGGPEWLQVLRVQAGGQGSPEAVLWLDRLGRTARAGRAASDAEVAEAFGPLLAWLGTGWGSAGPLPNAWLDALATHRTQLLTWLDTELGAQLVVAAERDGFEPDAMESVGERRTAHPHERGTVARLQTPGLRRQGRILLRARVIRYEAGAQR